MVQAYTSISGVIPPPSFTVLPFFVLNSEISESGIIPTLPSSFG